MKTKNILFLIAALWLAAVIFSSPYSFSAIVCDYTIAESNCLPSILEFILVIIALALPSWILFLIALKLHMEKKSIFSWENK